MPNGSTFRIAQSGVIIIACDCVLHLKKLFDTKQETIGLAVEQNTVADKRRRDGLAA